MIDLTQLESRDGLGNFLNKNGLVGQMVEVGSLTGEYARQIMSQWNGLKLYMVDPWTVQDDNVYKEPVNHCDWESCVKSCQSLAIQYSPRIELHKAFSPEAAKWYVDGSMDAIYIDANHSYDCCTADLGAWWPKIKSGGVLGLHDFRTDLTWPQNCDVKTAVIEFADRLGLRYHYTPPCGSVWFVKP